MRWKKLEFWAPIPTLAFSPRFSLRFLLLSVLIAAVVFVFYQPRRSVSRPVTLAPAPAGATRSDAKIYEETQLALLQSPFVITTAVRRVGVQQLDVLRNKANPIEWIQSHLDVAPSKQTGVRTAQLTIVTREGDVRELKVLVDAIADAYEQEILAAPPTAVP